MSPGCFASRAIPHALLPRGDELRMNSWRTFLQRVASILTYLQVDVTSANQTNPSSRPHMCIMRCGSCSLKPAVDREASEYDVLYRVGTQTMIDLAHALAFALLMLIPISDPTVLGGVLLVLSLGGALDSLRTIARRGWLHGWTHYVSLGCFAVLVLSALVLLLGDAGVGLYFVGPAIGVLIIAGTRNTWELLLRARGRDAS